MVNLMTLHSAKGLEFDTVFLPGWEEGLFPNQRAMEENGLAGARRGAPARLCRADPGAAAGVCVLRRQPPHPRPMAGRGRSRFIDELPDEHIEIVAELGLGRRRPGTPRWRRGRVAPSPGWAAPGTRRAPAPPRPPPLLDQTAAAPPRGQEVRRVGGFAIGDRVFHQKFGYGTVRCGRGQQARDRFRHAGDKKVMDAFVEHA